ncbi:MAG: hypothetical protein J6J23_00580 [Clostridia bacterium]|nr:hypothetical protein [Clostridia bacterium]
MNTREQIKKLASLLEGKGMYFDHKSYDFAEDIPHLILEGKRENIEFVVISEDGTFMVITTADYEIGLSFTEDEENTFETIDKELEECGMDEFLKAIYYNHPRSGEIGDYEDDFLNLGENTSTEETKEVKTQTYRVGITFIEHGYIDVSADSIEDALEKARSMDGDYFSRKIDVTNAKLIEIRDE